MEMCEKNLSLPIDLNFQSKFLPKIVIDITRNFVVIAAIIQQFSVDG